MADADLMRGSRPVPSGAGRELAFRVRRIGSILGSLTVAIAIVLGGAVLLGSTPTRVDAAANDFSMSGSVVGLYPGHTVTVDVQVTNHQPFLLTVDTASTEVGDGGPGCDATNVVAHTFHGSVAVPAGGSAVVPVQLTMINSAPVACQGAEFPLAFAASGVLTNGSTNGGGTGTNGALDELPFTGPGSTTHALALVGLLALLLGWLVLTKRRLAADEPQ